MDDPLRSELRGIESAAKVQLSRLRVGIQKRRPLTRAEARALVDEVEHTVDRLRPLYAKETDGA